MKYTLLHISKTGQETKVPKFATSNEAMQCAGLLQAKCEQDNCYYYVQGKDATGQTFRRAADTFTSQIFYMAKSVQQNIKIALS